MSYLELTSNENSAVFKGSRLFDISPEKFTNWRWQMKHQLRDPQDFERIGAFTKELSNGFQNLEAKFNVGVTPYYASLFSDSEHCPIRLQALPSIKELDDPFGIPDPLDEVAHSPVKEVVHAYPDRVAFCVAQLCPVYCRYCFRKRRDDEEGLHFNRKIVERGLAYIESNPAIKDVLITGGDPFLALDESLVDLVEKIRLIKHVEIIRFGTRTPVTLPYRITEELVNKLKQYHPIWINTHFNCPEEFTPEAELALKRLADAGFPIGNQAVLLKGVNDSNERMMSLCRLLIRNRVRPYYVFHPHLIEGTQHLRVSLDRGMKIMKSLRGNLTGFGIPTFAIDTPSGKVPVEYPYVIERDGHDVLIENIRGEIWREKMAYFD